MAPRTTFTTFVLTLLSLSTTVSSQTTSATIPSRRQATSSIAPVIHCPAHYALFVSSDSSYCCPGQFFDVNTNVPDTDPAFLASAYCCVGATETPFALAPTTTQAPSCRSTIMMTDMGYQTEALAASSLTTTTMNVTTSSVIGLQTSAINASTTARLAVATNSTSSSTGGGAVATSVPLAGAVLAAGGLFALVAL